MGGSLQLNPIGSYSESFSSISHFGLSYCAALAPIANYQGRARQGKYYNPVPLSLYSLYPTPLGRNHFTLLLAGSLCACQQMLLAGPPCHVQYQYQHQHQHQHHHFFFFNFFFKKKKKKKNFPPPPKKKKFAPPPTF